MRVAVIGAGSWGTAFASVIADNGVDTVLWARRAELADAIESRHENPEYLPGLPLPSTLASTDDLEAALAGATVAVMAVPSHAFRSIFERVAPHLGSATPVVSLSKGIEQDTHMRMTQVIEQEAGLPASRVAVLSGPNLAKTGRWGSSWAGGGGSMRSLAR